MPSAEFSMRFKRVGHSSGTIEQLKSILALAQLVRLEAVEGAADALQQCLFSGTTNKTTDYHIAATSIHPGLG